MHRRISLLIAAVAVLCLAIAVPTASAGKKTDRAQTKAIKKGAKAIKKNSASIKKGSKEAKALKNSAAAATGAINALKVVAARADKNGADFAAAAPTVIASLTALRDNLTLAGAGLTRLGSLVNSQEYGFGQMVLGATAQPGAFLETPDIPDTAQQASATQQFVAPGTTPAATAVTVSYGIRGTEVEPTGPQGFCRTTVQNVTTGATASTATDPIGGGAATTGFLPVATASPFAAGFGQAAGDVASTATIAGVTVGPNDPYTVTLACIDTTVISATDVTN